MSPGICTVIPGGITEAAYHYLISQEFTLKLQLHCDEEKRIGGKWLNPNQSVDSIFFATQKN